MVCAHVLVCTHVHAFVIGLHCKDVHTNIRADASMVTSPRSKITRLSSYSDTQTFQDILSKTMETLYDPPLANTMKSHFQLWKHSIVASNHADMLFILKKKKKKNTTSKTCYEKKRTVLMIHIFVHIHIHIVWGCVWGGYIICDEPANRLIV